MNTPLLLGLGTAGAPHVVPQRQVREAALAIFQDAEFDAADKASVFENAGIEQRSLAWPLERYLQPATPGQRNARFAEVAPQLLIDAARKAATPEQLAQVTHVVSVCTSGVAVPSLDARVHGALGLDPGVRRVPVFGLGCAGGAAGLAIARDLARSEPGARVLLLVVELTSLTLLSTDRSQRNLVACALFGDGAAAALVGAPQDGDGPGLAQLDGARSTFFANSEDLMGWEIVDDGWRLVMSPRIPGVVRREARRLVDSVMDGDRPVRWVLHPGGAKVMDAYRTSLELSDEDLAPAAAVLRDFGNMSATTVLFVLERVLGEARAQDEPAVLTAFGPGFTAEAQRLTLLANNR